jgi:thiamine transport system substrate-binding protein
MTTTHVTPRARAGSGLVRLVAALAALLLLAAAGPEVARPAAAQEATPGPTSITLMAHDSFDLPQAVLDAFSEQHGVELRVLAAGDAGLMVNQAVLTADNPLADVIFGIDDSFLSRALDADILLPYRSPLLDRVPEALRLDPDARATPIDVGHVCLNVDPAGLEAAGVPVPERLEDLIEPAYRGLLVVQNPATSSPGLVFLAGTVARFGEGGWQDFWRALRDNDVAVTSGWSDAYYGRFSGGSGEGDRPIVVSYAMSPVAEVVFGPDPEAEEAPTRAIEDGCVRQIEFAGILRGTEVPELAGALIDHLLGDEAQAAIPLSMFVHPARVDVPLPEPFVRHGLVPADPLVIDPTTIAAERERWIAEWTDIVLR